MTQDKVVVGVNRISTEGRARVLCLAAGKDPDFRVGEGRGRPQWCDFREAARAEQVAKEQAALKVTLPAQTARFKNAPLTITWEKVNLKDFDTVLKRVSRYLAR